MRWKYNAFVAYSTPDWSIALTQIFRDGYKNQVLPALLNGSFDPPNDITDVDPYIIYDLAMSYTGITGFKLTRGAKNLFDTDPPIAVAYYTAMAGAARTSRASPTHAAVVHRASGHQVLGNCIECAARAEAKVPCRLAATA